MSQVSRIARHVRDIIRVHAEGRVLRTLLRPDAAVAGVPTVAVADTVLPRDVIDASWICYCVGVGEDIQFDRYLTDHRLASVWAFDPTPRAIQYMRTADFDRTRLHFVPVGVWKEDTVLRFHAPPNPQWVSHSVMEAQGGDGYFDAACRSVPALMQELGHDRIDLLKLNIEGAEHVVLESVLTSGIAPRVITLTWEGQGAFRKALAWTKRLRGSGYALLARTGWFYTYVREDSVRQRRRG